MQRSVANFKINTTRMQKQKEKFVYGRDYQKAFDRVPHSWIVKSLELIKSIIKLYHSRRKS
jgi:hypothetical protein